MIDLAERLKKRIKDCDGYCRTGEPLYADEKLVSLVSAFSNEIISALQFEEDMQTLADRDPRFVKVVNGFECWINMYNPQQRTSWKQEFTGKDIPEAARHAVEQMEGK